MKNFVIVIVGPTGCGKTALSIEVAKFFDGEIISGDSMQIYKELNIGSAKVTKEEMQGIPHHLIDIRSAKDEFSAGEFTKLTNLAISKIRNNDKLPIIVGGTGLFIQGIIEGYSYSSCPRQQQFRDECKKIASTEGVSSLYKRLQELNPSVSSKISENDEKRIIRALEIQTFSLDQPIKKEPGKEYIVIGLNMDRAKLYNNINLRVEKMMQNGLLDEVQNLYESGIDENYQAMKGIGYKEFIPYFKGESSLEECVELVKQHTRNYAKRQLTWFRRMDYITWFEPTEHEKIIDYIKRKMYENNNWALWRKLNRPI